MNRLRRWMFRGAAGTGLMSLLRRLLDLIQLKKDESGNPLFPYVRKRSLNSAQILVYHRVNDDRDDLFPGVPVEVFKRQMEYLAENYRVCKLDHIVEMLQSGNVPENALAITFDDGYRDNYEHAFPILNELKLPATIFLATDAIGSGQMLWHDRLFVALRESRTTALENFDGKGFFCPLNTPVAKRQALSRILQFLWSLEESERSRWMEKFSEQLAVRLPETSEGLMLSWEEVRAMSENGIGFGAHTVTHPILSRLSPDQVKRQIRVSKEIIEANVKMSVKHFAYPVGRREDFTVGVKEELRDAGFVCAMTTIAGTNHARQDLFELRRATPWDEDIDSFALRLSYFKFAS